MNIHREILRLAVPSILANITIPLVGLVDTAIVGHISDASAIGGIAIGTMLFDLLYWNFGFLRVGTSGLTAQAYGRDKTHHDSPHEGRESEVGSLLFRSLRVALIGALVCIAIQWLFVKGVLALVPCSAEVAAFAERYFFVRIWAAPATLSLMALKGWFIGMQDTVSPMATDILVNVVNMLASYVLAVYTPLGGVGVAWGTLIAQYAGLTLALGILGKKYQLTSSFSREGRGACEGRGGSSLFRLNSQLFVRSLCFMVVYVGFTSLASKYGDTELAVSAILMKLFMLFSYFVDGFAYAGEALVGKQIGEMKVSAAGQGSPSASLVSRLRSVVVALFAWSLGVGAVFTLVYALWGSGCIGMMTDDAVVRAAAMPYMGWLIAMPIVSTLAFMWDGVYVGAAAGKEIMIAMIWAAVAFVAGYVATEPLWGVQALYVGYFAHLLARVIYLTAKWRRVIMNYEKIVRSVDKNYEGEG
ncbi:MAG: MATE family efflux transporter [Bacteroidales bacterium]|nr:MATE family efflux transporter [Bacteroidales bacterium]